MTYLISNKNIITCALAAMLITTSACTPTQTTRGNFLEERQMQDIKVGQHNRYDVLKYMGSPTTTAPFNENKWYYIGQKTEKRGILDQDIIEEQIITVEFDTKGMVTKIERMDAEREDIPVSKNKTATSGNEITFIQQMLGNLGKFNTPEQNPAR